MTIVEALAYLSEYPRIAGMRRKGWKTRGDWKGVVFWLRRDTLPASILGESLCRREGSDLEEISVPLFFSDALETDWEVGHMTIGDQIMWSGRFLEDAPWKKTVVSSNGDK